MPQQEVSIIDIHSHLYPRWYIDLLKSRTEIPRVSEDADGEKFVIFPEEESVPDGGRPISEDFWSVEAKLQFMDRFNISQTILSLGNPWLDAWDAETGLQIARRFNDDFAGLRDSTGGRILGMGVLPGQGVEGVVTVIREIADTDGLFGAITGTRLAGLTFDDPDLDPVWQALNETGLPLLVHPHHGSAMNELEGFGHAMPVAVGFPLETTISLCRLIFAGVLNRYPGVRIIGSHGGGTIPYLAGRLDAGWRSDPALAERMPTQPSEVLDRLYLDAVLYHPRALQAAADLVGTDHLMFGTDHPFSISDPEACIVAITDAFDADDASRVLGSAASVLYDTEPISVAIQG